MNDFSIKFCPGTLKENETSYSTTALKRMFGGKKVSPILPYHSPTSTAASKTLFTKNKQRISISGVQEKFSVVLDKNEIRLVKAKEVGSYILKPIPQVGKRSDQMPANEHLSMQIARQVFGIETAENALVFFKDGTPAYLTKRFDIKEDGSKWAQEDFASLAERTPQTHGANFKYLGSYFELFELLKKYCPAYAVESLKLFQLILFNFLISNGDAHLKNFSLIETNLGDFRLSPAYDLLNSRIHISDKVFALDKGLLPPKHGGGTILVQFYRLGELAGIPLKLVDKTIANLTSYKAAVEKLIAASFLDEKTKRNYLKGYETRLKNLSA
jgi:serine/threonine-protein kinase HipA